MASITQVTSAQPENKPSPDAAPLPIVYFKAKKGSRPNSNFRKRPTTPEKVSDSDDGSHSDEGRSPPGTNSLGKRRRRDVQSAVSASSKAASAETKLFSSTFEADRKAGLTDANDAAKHRDRFDEPTARGPARAGNNVRTTTLMDYAPDVCKDYQKSGWCGFGDSCKYLHDRTDMKKGWELDRDWEVAAAGRTRLGGRVVASLSQKSRTGRDDAEAEDDESDSASKIPSRCIICEQPYKSPVVTACGHYFCESCALWRYRRDPTCVTCGAGTNGVFRTASRLQEKLKRRGADVS